MVKGKKLGLGCPLSCQNTGLSFPDKTYARTYHFSASKWLFEHAGKFKEEDSTRATPEVHCSLGSKPPLSGLLGGTLGISFMS
jgi:hypothetical protein